MAMEDKNPVEEEGKYPTEEEGKNSPGQIATCASTLDGQDVQQSGGAEKTHEPDGEEPPNKGGAKRTQEPVCAENAAANTIAIMGVTEKSQEPVDAQEPHLPGGAENKRKRVELKKIKKEKQLSGVENKGMRMELKKIKKEQELGGAEKKRKRVELEKIKKEKQFGGTEKTKIPVDGVRWRASYSVLLHHLKKKKLYEGSILLEVEINRVLLLNHNETPIDFDYLKEGESIHQGSVFEFPLHLVHVGEHIVQPDAIIEDEGDVAPVEKKRKRLKQQKKEMSMRLPQAKMLRSAVGMLARVTSLGKGLSPRVKPRESESTPNPNVTVHLPSPNLARRRRPRMAVIELIITTDIPTQMILHMISTSTMLSSD